MKVKANSLLPSKHTFKSCQKNTAKNHSDLSAKQKASENVCFAVRPSSYITLFQAVTFPLLSFSPKCGILIGNWSEVMKMRTMVKDGILTSAVLCAAFILVVVLHNYFGTESVPSMVFVLAVFIISRFTQGYLWGIISSLISVLAVNFAFTFPYFEFNFIIPENLFSCIVMLITAIMTSTLTTNLKKQESMRAENEKEKMRANLLRAVSHDLRTPLTSIYGSCSTIMENYDSLEKSQQIKLLGEVCADATWLARMVENLLSITHINSGKVSVQKTSTVLEELVDSVIVKFKKHYPTQSVKVDIPEAFISIPMDSILIQQVIINLLENAVHHAKGMTELTLRVFLLGNKAIFEISDNGCGMDKEILATLFTGKQVQESPDTDGERRGMGIGLSVCATIIKAHGGDIQAQSKPGLGTTIRFCLETEETNTEHE